MTSEIRNAVLTELDGKFSSEQLKEIDLAVAKALQGYSFTKEETLPAVKEYPSEVQEFIARKRVKGCSENTIKQYRWLLSKFVCWARKDLKEMTDLDILIFLDYMQSKNKISNCTLDNYRTILSSFYSFLHDSGRIATNPMRSIDPIKYTSKVRTPLTDIEMEQIRGACRNEQERALVEVFYSTGARVSEIAGLNRADVDYANRRAVITGKGNKQRFVFFNAKSLFALQKYLETRTDEDEALFVNRQTYKRLTKDSIEYLIRQAGKRAGLSRPLFPHLFRHTMATDMLEHGAPINEVSKILGHTKIETTEIYAKATTDMLAREHQRCIA